jgi:NAD(P)-dependent dehydrogenase (short-subunit alcohol dehydrogenase family)
MNMKLLEGKVAIVTGAGRPKGMGRATALKLAEEGARVVVTDVARARKELTLEGLVGIGDDFSALEGLVSEIEALGSKAMAAALDVTDAAQVQACVEKTCETFGGVDILFNNAGTAVGVGSIMDIADENWELSWQVNVKGMVALCRAVIPKMIERGGGSIINNASMAGLGAAEGYGAYTVTKFAVVGLTKAVAAEFGRQNIRCNAVCPGMILTDMGEEEIQFISMEKGVSMERARQIFGEVAAMGRAGRPEEVADVVAYLAGPRSGFVTGVAIPVAGGLPLGV